MSLSEKTNLGIVTHTNQRQYEWVKLDDVREAVKELKEFIGTINDFEKQNEEIQDKIDEIFGEKLS